MFPCTGPIQDLQDFVSTSLQNNNRDICIPPGTYDLDGPLIIEHPLVDDNEVCSGWHIDAWGVFINQTAVVASTAVCIDGLTVSGAPSHGWVFLRGQGASHRKLTALNCAEHGFYFGSDGYGANSQVAWSNFLMCCAIGNGGDALHVDGRATANRNWLNATDFISFAARENAGRGIGVTNGSGPNGQSRFNYNNFTGFREELNGLPIDMTPMAPRANHFVTPHFVNRDASNTSIYLAPINYIDGGRIVGDVSGKTTSTIHANTSAPGEGARFSYDPASDLD